MYRVAVLPITVKIASETCLGQSESVLRRGAAAFGRVVTDDEVVNRYSTNGLLVFRFIRDM